MVAKAKKRKKLSARQIKFFGTKAQKAALKRKRASASGKVRKRATTRRTTRRTTKKQPAGGILSSVKSKIALGLGLSLAALEVWVVTHGGWSSVYNTYKQSGILGLITWALGGGGKVSAQPTDPSTNLIGIASPATVSPAIGTPSSGLQGPIAPWAAGLALSPGMAPELGLGSPQPKTGGDTQLDRGLIDRVAKMQEQADAIFFAEPLATQTEVEGDRLSSVDYGTREAAQAALAEYYANFV